MNWLTLLTVVSADDSLLWGPYRPGLYFGMRPRLPESLVSGLMWYETSSFNGLGALRHECKNTDDVSRFGWTAYDPRVGGQQVIYDHENRVNLTTELVKSEDGAAWEVRIRGDQASTNVLNLVWYTSLETVTEPSSTEFLALSKRTKGKLTEAGIDGDIDLIGSSDSLGGPFRMRISAGKGAKPTHKHPLAALKPSELTHYFSLQVPSTHTWQIRDLYMTLLQDHLNRFMQDYGTEEVDIPLWSVFCLADTDRLGGNTHIIQKTFKGPFEFTITFEPESHADWSKAESFDDRLKSVLAKQEARFKESLAIQEPYKNDPEYYAFAKEMLSSVAGGIGYFYGDSLVKEGDEVVRGPVRELFTGTPSRTFFPRGFYWDEGLNALALMHYDTDLVLQIINSWFATMDEDGWIEREQILGDEARARVPEEFRVQKPEEANPPTLVMALAHLGQVKNDPKLVQLLAELYPRLQRHFDWLRRTQEGEIVEFDRNLPNNEVYRWRARTEKHILASGLDDYPRAPPSNAELHVDLLSWVGAMARSLAQVAKVLDKPKDAARYEKILSNVETNLEKVFWSPEDKAYCDISADEFEEDVHVCHIGYVTLLPFMLKLVPPDSDAHLLALLDQIADPYQLWSVAGVRSLSMADPYFGTDENYWRGPVWNCMNFLALDALQFYAENSSPHVAARAAKIYHDLRRNVVKNIHDQWVSTGYVWESYESITGAAKGAKAFTGWSGLVANIMAMPDEIDVIVHDEV